VSSAHQCHFFQSPRKQYGYPSIDLGRSYPEARSADASIVSEVLSSLIGLKTDLIAVDDMSTDSAQHSSHSQDNPMSESLYSCDDNRLRSIACKDIHKRDSAHPATLFIEYTGQAARHKFVNLTLEVSITDNFRKKYAAALEQHRLLVNPPPIKVASDVAGDCAGPIRIILDGDELIDTATLVNTNQTFWVVNPVDQATDINHDTTHRQVEKIVSVTLNEKVVAWWRRVYRCWFGKSMA